MNEKILKYIKWIFTTNDLFRTKSSINKLEPKSIRSTDIGTEFGLTNPVHSCSSNINKKKVE